MGISPVLWQFLVKWLHSSALFPAEASTIAPYMDALYFFLVAMSLVGLIFVAVLIFYFSLRYRRDKHPVATQVEGSTLLEATWTIIPLAIFLVVFVWGALAVLPDLRSATQRDEYLRRRQAVDVEGRASGRPA